MTWHFSLACWKATQAYSSCCASKAPRGGDAEHPSGSRRFGEEAQAGRGLSGKRQPEAVELEPGVLRASTTPNSMKSGTGVGER